MLCGVVLPVAPRHSLYCYYVVSYSHTICMGVRLHCSPSRYQVPEIPSGGYWYLCTHPRDAMNLEVSRYSGNLSLLWGCGYHLIWLLVDLLSV
jgi:hypothetical protein